jgi:hypothetical protein
MRTFSRMILISSALFLAPFSTANAQDDNPPECTSEKAIRDLTGVFNQSQYALRSALTLNEITNIEEYGELDRTGARYCTGIGFLNNGLRTVIDYSIAFKDRNMHLFIRWRSYNFIPLAPRFGGW